MDAEYITMFNSYKNLYFKLGAVEDDIQDAFIKINKTKPSFLGRSKQEIRNYMITAVMSCKYDRLRSSYHKNMRVVDFMDEPLYDSFSEFNSFQDDTNTNNYWESVFKTFDEIYNLLDDEQKLYILMRFFRGLTGKEISKITGDSQETIKGRMFRMKKTILKHYGKI
tara:strand:- start:353 stop:853 length:501 start_codon:yes stop_codon:yes gene_type:complete